MPEATERVIKLAKRATTIDGASELFGRHFLAGALADKEARALLAEKYSVSEVRIPSALDLLVAGMPQAPEVTIQIPLAPEFRTVFQSLYQARGGFPPLVELLEAVVSLEEPEVRSFVAANSGSPPVEHRVRPPASPETHLGQLSEEVTALRNELSRKVIGQRSAVQQVADGLFVSQLSHARETDAPRAVLLFLGPPGVGKTYTAQLIAEHLCGEASEAFLRLDMSGYADPDAHRMLVGFEPSYRGARPGLLTEHLEQHPQSVILIDEIEKANRNVHNLFLQILDRGQLEDKYHKRNVSFGRSVIVFTTNLGQDLYQNVGRGAAASGGGVSRAAVLEALRSAVDPRIGLPVLTPELCSRLAKGSPILFNHLEPQDLERIARASIEELSLEFEQQMGVRLQVPDERSVTLMLLSLGPDLDARTITTGVPSMLKDAFRDVVTGHRDTLFGSDNVFDRVSTMSVELPKGGERGFFDAMHEGGRRVLVVTDRSVEQLGVDRHPDYQWATAESGPAAIEQIRHQGCEFVLVDVDLHGNRDLGHGTAAMQALRRIRTACPEVPVWLLAESDGDQVSRAGSLERMVIAGGAKGHLHGPVASWPTGEACPLEPVRTQMLRERRIRELFATRQRVRFTWDVALPDSPKDGSIVLRPKDVHQETVVASKDLAARLTFTGIPAERFEQVAGAIEAKRRLQEVVSWMRHPEAIRSLGVDLPTGVLLEGPPGNGKTLLARATAGEAQLPFFAANATDFSSKYVGESEANVRELFERAAAYAPSILFIDEIDAIGARRSMSQSGVHDALLTQLLVSMDGFNKRERPVFFLAATNRADLLDPALKRPGRFDNVITIDELNHAARRCLLEIKTRKTPLAADASLDEVARITWGLSGAQLTQVIKEAAILAFRQAKDGADDVAVGMQHFLDAVTNVRFGLSKEGPGPSEGDLRMTAYHEASHALIGELERPGSVHQATILPRGRALGFVESAPEDPYHSHTLAELRGRMRVALAGRCGEGMVFGEQNATAGCSQDLETATRIASLAVARFGMSEELGPVSVPLLEEILPRSSAPERAARAVEAMVRAEDQTVRSMLEEHREALHELAELLMREETVPGETIARIVRGAPVPHEV
jgi:ATP-dependent metalloprotease FtsH